MKHFLLGLTISVMLCFEMGEALADPMVSLSSPDDLSHLSVGNQVTIDVNLMGLPVNDFIFDLDTSVLFPSSQFQMVPDLSNTSGLTTGLGQGLRLWLLTSPRISIPCRP